MISANAYGYTQIWMNGRLVSIASILANEAQARSAFEIETFTFIRDWLSGSENFRLSTSGSTGKPKEVVITRNQMMASARQTAIALDLKPNSTCLICIDTKYIGGKMMLVRALIIGMRILAVDPCSNPLQKIPVDQCVNFTAFVPMQVEKILGSKHPHLLESIETAIVGGAPLREHVIQELDRYTCAFYLTYGMTETISHVALRKLNGPDKSEVFHALPEVQLSLDERKCLVVSANYLPDAVTTNDLVELISPKSFRWLGRLDNVINSGGVKVHPEKIEAALEQALIPLSGKKVNYFVHGIEDKTLGSRAVVIVEGGVPERDLITQALTGLDRLLHPYEIPKLVFPVPSFTYTENGKINRLQTVQSLQTLPA